MEELKGTFFLDGLRRKLGDDAFLGLMQDFFTANTTKTVTAQAFLDRAGVAFELVEPGDGPAYLVSDILRRLANAVLVYGTGKDAGANRYAAEQLQSRYLRLFEAQVPIHKDFEVDPAFLAHRDVIFVGRPESNSALSSWATALHLDYDGAMFRKDGKTHASENDAIALADRNPLDPSHMVLVLAGNAALATVRLASGGRSEMVPFLVVSETGGR
jgi:hypothetical protein